MECVICLKQLGEEPQPQAQSDSGALVYRCANCGDFTVTEIMKKVLEVQMDHDELARAVLSHAIRKRQREDEPIPVTEAFVDQVFTTRSTTPNPAEQADNLIQWLGDNLDGSGPYLPIAPNLIQAVLGSRHEPEVEFVMRHLVDEQLIEKLGGRPQARLTFEGWERYEALKREVKESRKAFMAMQYGDPELDGLLNDVLRPAALQTGFELYKLEDMPQAGLIDNRMRVEIRKARFIVADLTHDNHGAYWEAGFAEGLGKPVIYICKKSKFNQDETHFDTNHQHTILWDLDELERTAEEFKATIRATLPESARLEDD